MRWFAFGIGGLILAWSLPLAAQARSVGVAVAGCDIRIDADGERDLGRDIARALSLELGAGFTVEPSSTPDHELILHIEMRRCDDTQWTLRIAAPDGRVIFGPEPTTMGEFTDHARVRIAALWAAERLVEQSEREAANEAANEAENEAEPVASPETTEPVIPPPPAPDASETEAPETPDAFDPSAAWLPTLMLGVGGVGFADPAGIDSGALMARIGLGARLHDLFFLSGSFEGGVAFEPYEHQQPMFRLCAEPQLYLALLDRMSLTVGPRGCLSASRHFRDSTDGWGAGVALGGLVRLAFDLGRGLGLGVRFDADAWERDGISASGSAILPWMGAFTGAVELTLF